MFGNNGKGYEGRRNRQVFKGAAHAVLAADGRNAHFLLGDIRAEEGADRLPPGLFVRAEALEEFLHGQINLLAVAAESYELGDGLDDSIERTVEGAPNRQAGVVAVGEDAGRRRLAVHDGDLGDHAFNGRLLVFAAEGHEDRTGADSAVEPFGKALFGSDVEGSHRIEPRFGDVRYFGSRKEIFVFRSRDEGLAALGYAVRIEKGSRNIDDVLAAPVHDEALRIRRNGDDRRFEVFFRCVFHEFIDVFRRDDDGHAFLRFGNSQFRAVEASYFFGTLSRLMSRPSVNSPIATETPPAPKSLQRLMRTVTSWRRKRRWISVPSGRCLLDFSSARFQGFDSVLFRRARRAAAAVAAGLAAEKDDDIAGDGRFADDVAARRCAETAPISMRLAAKPWL